MRLKPPRVQSLTKEPKYSKNGGLKLELREEISNFEGSSHSLQYEENFL
jgi:hypothetical protein